MHVTYSLWLDYFLSDLTQKHSGPVKQIFNPIRPDQKEKMDCTWIQHHDLLKIQIVFSVCQSLNQHDLLAAHVI